MTGVRFSILGPVQARRGGADLDLGGRQQRLTLALLLARAGTVVSLTELIDTIWDQDPPLSAANVVHRYIGVLRRVIDPDLAVREVGDHLVRHASGYQLHIEEEALDLLRFRRLAADARRTGDATEAVRLYAEALALWHGPVAAGLEPVSRTHPAFVAIESDRTRAVRDAADVALRSGQARVVIPALRRAADQDPLDEAVQARFLLALAQDGRQAEALELFQTVRRRLDSELGIRPGPELSDAYDRLLHQRHGTPATPETSATVVPRAPAHLPPEHPYFSGRDDVIARVESLLAEDRRAGRATVALTIDGMPGVGKTTLAVRLAHRLAPAYPDGQLFADLRGFAVDDDPMTPAEALRGFLSSLGVAPGTMPQELHALAGLYRTMLAGRRVLVVLDNGNDFEQVRHLLPGTAGSLAIVTGRNRLTSLVTSVGAHLIPLELPSPEEARDSLIRRLGARRIAAEPEAADAIVRLCGRLPLALAVVAARAAELPEVPLAEIVADLTSAREHLAGFGDDPGTDLAAVFSSSYRMLAPPVARLFRLLALHPAPDLSARAAAALAGVDTRTGKALLGRLVTQMLVQVRAGRYQLHDLLRAYAAELGEQHHSAGERAAAVDRLTAFYRVAARRADQQLAARADRAEPEVSDEAGEAPTFVTEDAAMAWFTAEQGVLAAVMRGAAKRGDHRTVWTTALSLQNFLHFHGLYATWAETAEAGLAAATAAGDRRARGYLLRSLAGARYNLGAYDVAMDLLRQSRELADGDDHELAMIDLNQAYVAEALNRGGEAVRHARASLEAFRRLGDGRAQANAMRTLGGAMATLGRAAEAIPVLDEALALAWSAGDARGAGHCWGLLGRIRLGQGDAVTAVAHWRRAADIYAQTGNPAARAELLLQIGDVHQAANDPAAARVSWQEGLDAVAGSGAPIAVELRDRLAGG